MSSQRKTVALVAGVATLLTSTTLSTVFALYGWFLYCLLATVTVVTVAMVCRAVRLPVWGQLLAMLMSLGLLLTWTFPSGHELLRVLPDGQTLAHFGQLLSGAVRDIRQLSVPVPEHANLNFLVAGGIGLVAIAVDLLACGLRRPALAGLPLLAVYSVPVAVNSKSVSFIPFALGAAGYLWLLITDHVDRVRRWGRRFTGDGRDVDTWEPSPLAASGRRVGFVGLVVAIVIPVLVPGMSSSLLDRVANYAADAGFGPGPGGGPGASINPISTLKGQLTLGKQIEMFSFQTDDPNPGYLRTAVADQLSADGFTAGPHHQRVALGKLTDPATVKPASLTSHLYQARVTGQAIDDWFLPVATDPVTVNPPRGPSWLYDPETGVFYADRRGTRGATYSFRYDSFDYTAGELRKAQALDPADPVVRADTAAPFNKTVQDLVTQLTAGRATQYDKVMAIESYFSAANGFRYDLQTKPGTTGSPITDFLASKQGFCEQYASAMGWMVRAAGFPSRVVVGYTHGTRLKNTYQVTNHEAHAWVEVYFRSYGWVPFDPTPAASINGAASFGWAPNPWQQAGTGSNTSPGNQNTPGPTGSADPNRGQHGEASATRTATRHRPTSIGWPYWVLAGVVALVLLLALPAAGRALLRKRRTRLPPPAGRSGPAHATGTGVAVRARPGAVAYRSDPHFAARHAAHATWDELMDTMVDLGLPVDEAETPRGTAERLIREPRLDRPAAESLRVLAQAEERARYAREPAPPDHLRRSYLEVRTALTARAPRRTRLGATLVPRSMVRRWRWRIGHAVGGALTTLSHAQHRLARTLTPRRLLAAFRSGR